MSRFVRICATDCCREARDLLVGRLLRKYLSRLLSLRQRCLDHFRSHGQSLLSKSVHTICTFFCAVSHRLPFANSGVEVVFCGAWHSICSWTFSVWRRSRLSRICDCIVHRWTGWILYLFVAMTYGLYLMVQMHSDWRLHWLCSRGSSATRLNLSINMPYPTRARRISTRTQERTTPYGQCSPPLRRKNLRPSMNILLSIW